MHRKPCSILLFLLAIPSIVSAQTATVYFYRTSEWGNAKRATINVDGEKVCSLHTGRVAKIALVAGQHTFSGPDTKQAAPLKLDAGKSYYFKASVDTSSARKVLFSVHNFFRVDLVSADVGAFDVRRLKPLEPSNYEPKWRHFATDAP